MKEITKSYLIAIKIHALLRVPFKDKSTKYIVYLYTSLLTLIIKFFLIVLSGFPCFTTRVAFRPNIYSYPQPTVLLQVLWVLDHAHSTFSFHTGSAFSYTSFFQIGTLALSPSMQWATASKESRLWGLLTAITTDASRHGTMPSLWTMENNKKKQKVT